MRLNDKCDVIHETIEERGIGKDSQREREKSQRAKRAGPVADQPKRLRTPPGAGTPLQAAGSQVSATRKKLHLTLVGREKQASLERTSYPKPEWCPLIYRSRKYRDLACS